MQQILFLATGLFRYLDLSIFEVLNQVSVATGLGIVVLAIDVVRFKCVIVVLRIVLGLCFRCQPHQPAGSQMRFDRGLRREPRKPQMDSMASSQINYERRVEVSSFRANPQYGIRPYGPVKIDQRRRSKFVAGYHPLMTLRDL